MDPPTADDDDDDDDDDGGDDDGLDPEEAARRAAIVAAKRAAKEEARLQAEKEKDIEAYKKRMLAEAGQGEFKHIQMSKKELAEKHKSKQGVRMAKTGPRRKKYDGPGSKIAREEEEKKKASKKKNP